MITSIVLKFGLTACQCKITSEDAKKIALEDAKVTETEVTFTSDENDNDAYVFRFQNNSDDY